MSKINAQSEYTINFQTLDGEEHIFIWNDVPLRYLHIDQRPHTQAGIQYIANNNKVFIPWHQIKVSWFKERILFDNEEP